MQQMLGRFFHSGRFQVIFMVVALPNFYNHNNITFTSVFYFHLWLDALADPHTPITPSQSLFPPTHQLSYMITLQKGVDFQPTTSDLLPS